MRKPAQQQVLCRYHGATMKLHHGHRSFSGTSHQNGHKDHNYWRCKVKNCPWVASCIEQAIDPMYENRRRKELGREYLSTF